MSEQLCYTWSDIGYGRSSAGCQVRAASRGLMHPRGYVDEENERLQAVKKYANYDLPSDTSNPLEVVPQQAPRSLLFMEVDLTHLSSHRDDPPCLIADKQRILVSKVYTGLDKVNRPGASFSHLLTDLPPVLSPCPDKQLPFSAREAIERWGSTLLWRDSEQGIDPRQLELPPVSNEELAMVGPLSAHHVVEVKDSLLYVIQAFLTLSTLSEGKRLYIAAPPDTVATLIWGLTHVLPRTLQIMQTLTFSTYERDLEEKMLLNRDGKATAEKPLPVIIGTCWLSPSTHDLPPIYYQEQNRHGLALNCYQPDRKTPFSPDPLVSQFAQFAIQCFTSGKMENLKALLSEAEKRNITDVPSFLALYTSFKPNIPKDDLTRLLKDLWTKIKRLLDKAVNALREGNIPPEDEVRQWKSIQSETDMLKRENVRNSIIRLLTNEPSWWQEQGQDLILKLANCYSDNDLSTLHATFAQAFNINTRSRKDQNTVSPTTFAQQITDAMRTAQDELATALQLLITDFVEQVVEAIWTNDDSLVTSWGAILATALPTHARIKANVWASLLQQLSSMPYTPVYHHWWTQYGKTSIREMSTLAHTQPGGELDQACSSFIEQAMQELLGSIKSEERAPLSFWQEVLSTAAPHTRKPEVWLDLLLNLCPAMDSPTYQQWWQAQGQEVANAFCQSAQRDPQGKIAKKLSLYAENVANVLYARMIDKTSKTPFDSYIQFLVTILTTVTFTDNPSVWPDLLQKLSTTMHEPVAAAYSWQVRSLLLETWAKIDILEKNQYIRRDWLTVRWDELDKLLSLKLPDDWYKVSITQLVLASPSDSARVGLIDTVTYYRSLFEAVLEQLVKDPGTQQTTLYFFALLANRHYSRIMPLFDRLLAACQYQNVVAEKLLTSLDLQLSQEVANLLENSCKVLLSKQYLTPTLVSFIEQYLSNFDPDYLDNSPTRELLLQLLKISDLRPDLHKAVEGWCRIAEFIQNPDVTNNRLRNLGSGISGITQLTPNALSKLTGKLVLRLVESVSTEIDLGRVIDNLGKVLERQGQGGIDAGLLLLERMAKIAGEMYGQERPLVRIAPYIKVVLSESRSLLPAEKENFVDRYLNALLKHIDAQTRNLFTTNPMLWSEPIFAEWRAYLYRSSRAAINQALHRFRSAIQSTEMLAIVQAYDPSLEGYLQSQEHELLKLAQRFVAAYQANDATALVKANDSIAKSPYRQQLLYTPEQAKRVKQAKNHMSVVSQPTAPTVPPNVPTRIPAPPPQISSQEAPASKELFIAKVKGQFITLEWFKQVLRLKGLYTQDRIRELRQAIQKAKEVKPDAATRKINKERENEQKELEKLLNNDERLDERLREATLDNLVNDVLIREEIDKLTRQDPANRQQWFDIETDLLGILDRLKFEQGNKYPFLISDDFNKLLEILRIFRRHELFVTYLRWNNKGSLQDWLKEQRHREKTEIVINYDLAQVKPKNKKTGWLNFLPVVDLHGLPGVMS